MVIQALDLVGRKMGMKKGAYFMNLLMEMGNNREQVQGPCRQCGCGSGCPDAVNKLAEMGMFLASCAKQGKFMVPVNNAYPFLMMMGKVVSGWLLLLAGRRGTGEARRPLRRKRVLSQLTRQLWRSFARRTMTQLLTGKIYSARFFAKNVLPEVECGPLLPLKPKTCRFWRFRKKSFAS